MGTQREEIVVRAGFDNTALASGMRTAKQNISHWAGEIATTLAGAFAVEKIFEFEKGMADWVKQLSLTAERLGVNTDEVQKLSYAATMTGTNLDTIATALDKLAKAKEKILRGEAGSNELAESFGRFGITIKQLQNLTPDQLFDAISESVAKTGANAEVTADAMALFGRAGGKLIPMLKELREQGSKAPIITEEEIANIRRAGEEWETFGIKMKVVAARITSSFADVFNALRTGQGIFAWQKKAVENLPKAGADISISPGAEMEGGKASGGGKKDVADLYQRRAELIRKINQLSKYSRPELRAFGDELNSIKDKLEIASAPNEEARLKAERAQAVRDLGVQQRTLVPEAGIPAYRDKVDSLTDKIRGLDFRIEDLHKTGIEKLAIHAEKQSQAMEKIAGAVKGGLLEVHIPSN